MTKNKGTNKGKNQQGPSTGGSRRGVKKDKSINIGDNVEGSTTTTSTGPKSPAKKDK